uniref:Protein-S-isoprenylcysteine O-methyltransferase n=1 Tax=Mycena chlorophos TaxID=658473 RepID=A0ABQ0LEK9_MYCCL|nr:predicted protein [Mycena chlorophos]
MSNIPALSEGSLLEPGLRILSTAPAAVATCQGAQALRRKTRIRGSTSARPRKVRPASADDKCFRAVPGRGSDINGLDMTTAALALAIPVFPSKPRLTARDADMSLPRVALVCVQTLFNELACTPPNPTQPKHRYHTEEPTFFQIAPLILRLHQFALRIICCLEILSYLAVTESTVPLPFSHITLRIPPNLALIGLPPNPSPLFLTGTLLVAIGAFLRVASFRALGEMFTFDLTIHPKHRLITSGPYAYVRHPAYTGTLCIIAGLVASHMTPGSFLGIALGGVSVPAWTLALCRSTILLGGAVWWTWMLGVGLSRIPAEEKKMAALFPAEWAEYEKRVRWWFVPRLV